jgi:predicted metal-dependent hydrolase
MMRVVASPAANRKDRPVRSLPIRRPTFDYARVRSQHWFGGDPFLTHLTNAMSLTFPEGERFFMDAVKHYERRVISPVLRHEIARFLGQEALHWRAHEAYNAWLRTFGLDSTAIERRVEEGLGRVRRERSPRYQLAMTCALEHFTAMMAELLLNSEDMRQRMDPEVRRLLVWHALEETEHKAVAFDVYLATGGSYRTRIVAMFITTVGFTFTIAMFQPALMRQDPGAAGLGVRLRGFAKLWVSPGWFLRLVPAYLDYFRPDFHPWDRPAPAEVEAIAKDLEASVIRA